MCKKFYVFFFFILVTTVALSSFAQDQTLFFNTKASVAAYSDKMNKLFYIEDPDEGLHVLDTEDWETTETIEIDGKAQMLAYGFNKVFVLSFLGETAQLTIIDPQDDGELDTISLEGHEIPSFSSIGIVSRNIVAIIPNDKPTLTFVDIKTRQIVTHDIEARLLYALQGFDIRNKKIYLPSAYPGEVIIVHVRNLDAIETETRIELDDWIHDVKLIDNQTALVSGHTEGIGYLDLESGDYHFLSDQQWSYLYLRQDAAYALAGHQLKIIYFEDDYIESIDLPIDLSHFQAHIKDAGLDKIFRYSPTQILGHTDEGELIILVRGKGFSLQALDTQ